MLHLLVVFFIASVHGYYGSQVDDFVGKVGLSTDVPKCATSYKHLNGNSTFLCLDDDDYPVFEIENSLYYHYYSISSMYKEVMLNTKASVDNLSTLREETYLCKSSVSYVKPVRAINSKGEWRIIINHLRAKQDFILQTVRLEICQQPGESCPKIPACYRSMCVQKFSYQRLLVFNPYDYYLPFSVESFKLPTSCDCFTSQTIE